MKTKEQLQQEIDELEAQKEPLKKQLNDIRKSEEAAVVAKVKLCHKMKDRFDDSDLIYAATARCGGCGAGLAYPKETSVHGSWDCSDILTGRATPGSSHDRGYPFAFYEIKSEDQPSANGATIRDKAKSL